jgi:murein DD-endopeptidase MepM/ murein hydrolase activator NlpD
MTNADAVNHRPPTRATGVSGPAPDGGLARAARGADAVGRSRGLQISQRHRPWLPGAFVLLSLALPVATAHSQGTAPAVDIVVFARAIQPGEVIRLDVKCTCGSHEPRVAVFDRDVHLYRVTPGTHWRGLVGIDLDTAPGEYPITAATNPGGRIESARLQVLPRNFQTRRLRVAPEYVEPPAATIERITREAGRLEALFANVSPRLWNAAFAPPLPTRPSDNFGARSVFNGEPRNPHGGIDFSSPTGTRVFSPGAGRVSLAEDLYFTGNTVIVDHGLGLVSVLAHLSAIAVTEGEFVERGTIVGRVGATGRVTGPHLHWGVRLNGARVDPLSLLAATN